KEMADLLDRLSVLACRRGSYAQATTLSEQSLSLQREIGNLFGLSESLQNRGYIAYAQQQYGAATLDTTESLKLKAHLGDRKGIIDSFRALAALAVTAKQMHERAAKLLGAAENLRSTLEIGIPPSERGAY